MKLYEGYPHAHTKRHINPPDSYRALSNLFCSSPEWVIIFGSYNFCVDQASGWIAPQCCATRERRAA